MSERAPSRPQAPAAPFRVSPEKVVIPDAPVGALERAELTSRFNPEDRRLTVFVGPGGFGKTTLLANCCRRAVARGARVVWLSVDEQDDAERVVAHLAYAVGLPWTAAESGGRDVQDGNEPPRRSAGRNARRRAALAVGRRRTGAHTRVRRARHRLPDLARTRQPASGLGWSTASPLGRRHHADRRGTWRLRGNRRLAFHVPGVRGLLRRRPAAGAAACLVERVPRLAHSGVSAAEPVRCGPERGVRPLPALGGVAPPARNPGDGSGIRPPGGVFRVDGREDARRGTWCRGRRNGCGRSRFCGVSCRVPTTVRR